jgi:hypothetical protein
MIQDVNVMDIRLWVVSVSRTLLLILVLLVGFIMGWLSKGSSCRRLKNRPI